MVIIFSRSHITYYQEVPVLSAFYWSILCASSENGSSDPERSQRRVAEPFVPFNEARYFLGDVSVHLLLLCVLEILLSSFWTWSDAPRRWGKYPWNKLFLGRVVPILPLSRLELVSFPTTGPALTLDIRLSFATWIKELPCGSFNGHSFQ